VFVALRSVLPSASRQALRLATAGVVALMIELYQGAVAALAQVLPVGMRAICLWRRV